MLDSAGACFSLFFSRRRARALSSRRPATVPFDARDCVAKLPTCCVGSGRKLGAPRHRPKSGLRPSCAPLQLPCSRCTPCRSCRVACGARVLLFADRRRQKTGFLDATASQDFVPAPNVIPVAMDDSRVAVVPNSPVAVNTLPAEAAPPRVTATPYGEQRFGLRCVFRHLRALVSWCRCAAARREGRVCDAAVCAAGPHARRAGRQAAAQRAAGGEGAVQRVRDAAGEGGRGLHVAPARGARAAAVRVVAHADEPHGPAQGMRPRAVPQHAGMAHRGARACRVRL